MRTSPHPFQPYDSRSGSTLTVVTRVHIPVCLSFFSFHNLLSFPLSGGASRINQWHSMS